LTMMARWTRSMDNALQNVKSRFAFKDNYVADESDVMD
jgi:hypothetical protein